MAIDKKRALSVVFSCAAEYQKNFVDKCLLFLFTDKHKNVYSLEVTFDVSNFLHLTGFEINEDEISRTDFFNRCLDKRLSEKDFEFKADGTTELKMKVLPTLMQKNLSAKMIGDYNNLKPKLYTERIAGSISGCMGFVQDEETGRYVPNTVLDSDIRDVVYLPYRIIATFRKQRKDALYSEIVYLAKKVEWERIKLPKEYEYLPLPPDKAN